MTEVGEGSPSRRSRDNVDALFDATTDPGGAAFGTLGSEASSELNWWRMIHSRVQTRASGSPRHQWWILSSLLAGLLALNFTFTVFNLILTQLADEFHTSRSVINWVYIGPILAYGLVAPIFGKLGDIFGHRRLYLLGLAGAMVSAAATALAPTVGLLIVARVLDGVAGAASGAASGAILNLVFSPQDRVKAGGWWSLIGAGGPVVGLSLGTPIIAVFGWRGLFWIQLGLIAVAFVVVSLILPHFSAREEDALERRQRARRDFKQMDWLGSWSLSLSIVALMVGLTFGQTNTTSQWTSPLVLGCWVVTILSMTAFVWRIRHAENPLIPPKYFTKRNFVWPMVVRTTSNFAYFAGFFLFPFVMELGYAKSTQETGLIAIARPITFAVCSPIAGYVAVRIGERVTAIAGAAFLTFSMVMFAALHPSTTGWFIIIALALSGLGQGVAMPSAGALMANEVDPSEFGVMSAAQLLGMQVGQVAGSQVCFAIWAAVMHHDGLTTKSPPDEILKTFQIPFIVGAAMAFISLLGSFLFRSLPRDGSVRDGAEPVYDAH